MNSKPIETADYLFIGLGAANCLLILNMFKLGLLSNKSVGIIEPTPHNLNERNFCFWATEENLLDLNLKSLISSKWEQIKVAGRDKQSISPLNYFHIRGVDLFTTVKEILKEQQTKFYTEPFAGEPQMEAESFIINLSDCIIIAHNVFDSRPPKLEITEKTQTHLLQSFFGWTLKTSNYTFDPTTMVMMDFDIPQGNYCQFMYILPFTEKTALFEVTRFGIEKISIEEAEKILEEYVARYGFSYQILEEERGIIPMSSAKISDTIYGSKWVHTGARANMIKPTTGYAFYNMAIDAKNNSEAILSQQPHQKRDQYPRFRFYDRLLLKILEEKPQEGKTIFQSLFKHVPIKNILNFLSERSVLSQEIFIFSKLPIFIFLLAAFKDVLHRVSKTSPTILALIATILILVLSFFNCERILYLLLTIGFFTVGLSHGALDHIVSEKDKGFKEIVKFSVKYIIKGVLLGFLWIISPDTALVTFLAFSAWHFGQADFNEWNINHSIGSFLWGGLVLSNILFFHLKETIAILENINGLQIHEIFTDLTESKLLIGKISIVFCTMLIAFIYKSKQALLTLCYLLLCAFLPLVTSFAIYFVLQHSLHGWRHLKKGLKISSYNLWLKSLPFSLGGVIIISIFMLTDNANYISLFFILLSCLSMPHVISMHNFYLRVNLTRN